MIFPAQPPVYVYLEVINTDKMIFFWVIFIVTFLLGNNHAFPENATSNTEITINSIVNEIEKDFPYILSGHDEDGAPIWIFEPGKWDFRKYVDLGGVPLESLTNHIDKMVENLRESALNSTGKQIVIISNLDGWGIRQLGNVPTLNFLLKLTSTSTKVLKGEHMKKIIAVNGNFLFKQFWQLLRPIVGTIGDTVYFYGTNKDTWIPKILKEFPKDELPESYGGSKGHRPLKVYG